MNKMKWIFAAAMCLTACSLWAQENAEEWFHNARPEHYEEVSVEAKGVHRVMHKIGSQATASLKSVGTQRVPVVLVSFKDKKFSVADTDEGVNAFYQLFCNGTHDGTLYTGHGSHGSIRDYFVEQSDSAFLPEFVVIGPVALDSVYAYYGANSGNTKDIRFSAFRDQAIAKAMEVQADWEQFDNDGNGNIDMVFFIFAGLGENSGGDANCIWPKETTASTTINGHVFATSAATCEARPKTWNADHTEVLEVRPDGVGVFIHELSHALGLPDFYDTKNVAFGMDLWSVMDYGEYGNNGYNPGNYTAYERDFMGWQPLQVLDEPCVLTIPCFADGGYGYKIQNDAAVNEYYIIENRQAKGWDDRIGGIGHGLQVTHVDFDAARWNSNTVNTDPEHQRMTIIAANNLYIGTNAASNSQEWVATLMGNLYPGDTYNYNLTDESTPAATVYQGGLLHKPLRNITENKDGTVTVCFRTHGKLDIPEIGEPTLIEMDRFDTEWSPVDNATRYAWELYKDSIVIRQDTLADCKARIDGLQPSSDLKFRVKAMADMPEDYVDSDWSDFIYLSTLADFITSVDESEKTVEVYAMNGMCMGKCLADELHRLTLQRGIYVVRYANGASRKVMMK